MARTKQPWLHSAWLDSAFILSPPFLCLAAIMLFPDFFQQHVQSIPVSAWVLLVLLIDVGHVYSTLFMTYFEKETFQKQKQLFTWAPFIAWGVGILLYSISGKVFWSVLAYLAVYHFVRQQYGFLRLYTRKDQPISWERKVDAFCMYAATLLPILYWHLEDSRNFHWFISGDFISGSFPVAASAVAYLNIAVAVLYILKEGWLYLKKCQFNLPKNLVVIGTFLSWYLGIVHYNGDLIFTTFNVVSHGVPYLALVWMYGQKRKVSKAPDGLPKKPMNRWAGVVGILYFLGLVIGLAYLEESLWDAMVWREHAQVFPLVEFLPKVQDEVLLSLLVPLLALPQITHYILDGFIWKVSKSSTLVEA